MIISQTSNHILEKAKDMHHPRGTPRKFNFRSGIQRDVVLLFVWMFVCLFELTRALDEDFLVFAIISQTTNQKHEKAKDKHHSQGNASKFHFRSGIL